MLNFAIIEDDEKNLNRLKCILESIFLKYDYSASIGLSTLEVDSFLDYVANNRIDAFFINDIKIAEKVRKLNKDSYLIIETSFIEYALIAYKFKTFDFICKPISYKRLEDCIVRLFNDISRENKKFIKIDNKNTIIAESEIKYIEKNGTKLIIHTDNNNYETYNSFSKIENNLPSNFVRCHKSFIANIDNIVKVVASDNTVYFNNSSCYIGPKYKKDFLEVIKNYDRIS